MTNDVGSLIDAHREVGRRQIGAGDARTAVIRTKYDSPIGDVWDACTNPERLKRWLMPVTGDLRVGGTFSLEGNASGEILQCEPPRLLTLTWVYGDRPVDEVRLRLSSGPDGGTDLELEHATVSTLVEWEGQMLDVIPGVGSGWELPLTYSLPALLRNTLPDSPPEQTRLEAALKKAEEAWNAGTASAEGG